MDLDLAIACDPRRGWDERMLAWERYETEQWFLAHRDHGLMLRALDPYMKDRVYKRLCLQLDATHK